MSMRTHKVRLTVRTKVQHGKLLSALNVTRWIYNAALEERSGAWSKNQIRITKGDQQKSITALKGDISIDGFPVNLLRWPLSKLDDAFKGFFRRVKAGQTPGYPRFRADARWDTFGYTDQQCWDVVFWDGDRSKAKLDLRLLGTYRLKLHRPIVGEIRSLQVKREGRKWFALITVRIEDQAVHPHADTSVGLDVGTTHLATFSTGDHIANIRPGKLFSSRTASVQQRLSRAKYGSKRRKRVKAEYLRLKQREANMRRTYLHQVSAWLVRHFGIIVIEDLKIRNMMRSASGTVENPGTNVAQKTGLNRSIGDAAWGTLAQFLTYKAESAGGSVICVDPRNSSNECHRCHAITPTRIGDLFVCPHCGLRMDRDHNAALVIEQRGVVVPETLAA